MRAFELAKANAGSAGVDKQSIMGFEGNLKCELRANSQFIPKKHEPLIPGMNALFQRTLCPFFLLSSQ